MSQRSTFELPFPRRVSPDLAAARERNVAWATKHRLITNEETTRRYRFSQVAEVAAYAYPDAVGDDLDLSFDLMGWFFLFDDQFDLPAGRYPRQAVDICQELIEILHRPSHSRADSHPLIATFVDCWRRMTEGMSQQWRYRTIVDWMNYFGGNLTEVVNRRHRQALTFDTLLSVRRKTIGVAPSLALGERVGGFEVPTPVWYGSHLEEMRVLTTDHVILVNEVVSLANDEARSDTNLILCLMSDQSRAREDAVDEVVLMANDRVRQFEEYRRKISLLCDRLDLSTPDRYAVERYAEVLLNWIRGNHDWEITAGRYLPASTQLIAATQTGMFTMTDS